MRAWEMGPFVKQRTPVLSPTPESRFQCPILGKEVRWEEQNVYTPAAVVRNGKVYLLYRADDKNPDLKWGRTCRIGLAYSEDGINFTRHPTPVLYPDNDPWKKNEWEGGCEDLHVVEGEDGTYYMNYITWNGHGDTMSVATSSDIYHWTEHGPAFRKATPGNVAGRSGVVVSRLQGNRLIAAKINGKYWMYYTHPCALAWSDNLIDWTRADKSVCRGSRSTALPATSNCCAPRCRPNKSRPSTRRGRASGRHPRPVPPSSLQRPSPSPPGPHRSRPNRPHRPTAPSNISSRKPPARTDPAAGSLSRHSSTTASSPTRNTATA